VRVMRSHLHQTEEPGGALRFHDLGNVALEMAIHSRGHVIVHLETPIHSHDHGIPHLGTAIHSHDHGIGHLKTPIHSLDHATHIPVQVPHDPHEGATTADRPAWCSPTQSPARRNQTRDLRGGHRSHSDTSIVQERHHH